MIEVKTCSTRVAFIGLVLGITYSTFSSGVRKHANDKHVFEHSLHYLHPGLGPATSNGKLSAYRNFTKKCSWIKIVGGSLCSWGVSDNHWQVTSFGPYLLNGSYQRIDVSGQLPDDGTVGMFLNFAMLSFRTKDGGRVDSTQIHLHHCNLFSGTSYDVPVGDWVQDRTCFTASGGDDCLLIEYPDGYGQNVPSPLRMYGKIYDLRRETTEKRFWVEPALFFVKKVTRQVFIVFVVNYPGPNINEYQELLLAGNDNQSISQITSSQSVLWPVGLGLPIQKRQGINLVWKATTVDLNSLLLGCYIHAHRIGQLRGLLWFDSPQAVGLNANGLVMPYRRNKWLPLYLNTSTHTLEQRLLPPSCSTTYQRGLEFVRGRVLPIDRDNGLSCSFSWPRPLLRGQHVTTMCIFDFPNFFAPQHMIQHCTLTLYLATGDMTIRRLAPALVRSVPYTARQAQVEAIT